MTPHPWCYVKQIRALYLHQQCPCLKYVDKVMHNTQSNIHLPSLTPVAIYKLLKLENTFDQWENYQLIFFFAKNYCEKIEVNF